MMRQACGWIALRAVTGADDVRIERAIRGSLRRWRRYNGGLYLNEVQDAAQALTGRPWEWRCIHPHMLVRSASLLSVDRAVLFVSGHFLAWCGGKIVDTMGGEAAPERHRCRRRRVKKYLAEVTPQIVPE